MTTFTPAQAYTQGGGTAKVNGLVVYQVGVPSATNIQGYKVGTISVDEVNNAAYILTSFTASNGQLSATWEAITAGTAFLETLTGNSGGAVSPSGGNINVLGSGALAFAGSGATLTGSITPGTALIATITGGTGGALSPTAGNFNILGTANQITSTGSGSTITLSTPAAFTAPGSVTATTTLTATLGAITATNGNLVLGTAGNKIVSTSVASTTAAGANSFGKVTLVGGTATVSTTAVTASSIIFLTRQGIEATGAAALGNLSVGTITAGTSFVINALSSTDATALATTDVSSIGWMIVN